MRRTKEQFKSTFGMANGSEFKMTFECDCYDYGQWDPLEYGENEEFRYYIDGTEYELSELPKGLSDLVGDMEQNADIV